MLLKPLFLKLKLKLRQSPILFKSLKMVKDSIRIFLTWLRHQSYLIIFSWERDKEIIKNHENLIYLADRHIAYNATNKKIKFIDIQQPSWVKLFLSGYHLPPYYCSVFEKAEVIGSGGIIVNNKGKIVFDSIMNRLRYFEYIKGDPRKVFFRKKQPVSQNLNNAIVLINPISGTYFHWLIEVLPRLIIFKEHNEDIYKKTKFVISENSPSFVYSSLHIFLGISNEDIIYYNGERFLIDKLYHQSYLHSYSSKYNISLYRDNILNKLFCYGENILKKKNTNYKESNENIIISRDSANKRRIVNELKLLNELSDFNFHMLNLDHVRFEEQINIFNKAKIIISMHGSALANIIFCEENALLIELFPKKRNRQYMNYYYQLSRARKMQHCIIGVEQYADESKEDIELTKQNFYNIKKAIEYFYNETTPRAKTRGFVPLT